MKNLSFFASLNLAFSMILLSGCRSDLKDINTNVFMVRTEKTSPRDLEDRLLLVGSVKALDEAVLYPRVPGKLLRNVLREGDPVKKNEPVAFIERDEVGVTYEPAPVPSTLTGVVGKTYLDAGANVTLQTPVALVVNQTQVRIKVDLPERYVGRIALGQTAHVTVEAYPDAPFTGLVSKISPVVDESSRNAPIEILVDNGGGKLKSGMFAQAEIVVGRKSSAVSVSAAAVQEDEKGPFVFLAMNGKAARRSVALGFKTQDFIEIAEGLRAGDRVVYFGLYGLKDGSAIQEISR